MKAIFFATAVLRAHYLCMKSKLVILLFCITALFITLNRGLWKEHQIIVWDATGYYMYLPAFVSEQDPWQLKFYARIDSLYEPSGSNVQYGIHAHAETGRRDMKYGMGVALFELPLFLVAHAITSWFTSYPPDGYSLPYQLAVALSSILWVILGLVLLRKFLLRHFPEANVWVCLLLLCAGTNLYYYTAFLQGWSHPYSFFLFALIIYLTERWYTTAKPRFVLFLGMALGLTLLTRLTNGLFILFPLLYNLASWQDLQQRGRFLLKHWLSIILSLTVCVGLYIIQLWYIKYTTGYWFVDNYKGETFDFLHPSFWKGFFSYRKGWLIYTPAIAFLLGGFVPLYRNYPKVFAACFCYMLLQIYVVFSWKAWHYGGCFSCRPMVESLALLSIPACALIEYIRRSHYRIVKNMACTVGFLLIILNVFQTYQYSLHIIHFDRMTKAYYWRVFGKLKVEDEDLKLLRQPSEDEPD